jgi:hypothetical protein
MLMCALALSLEDWQITVALLFALASVARLLEFVYPQVGFTFESTARSRAMDETPATAARRTRGSAIASLISGSTFAEI